jgi:PAS domain S-box-containing protein
MSSEEPVGRSTQLPGAMWALEATTDNVILLDRDFRITFINKATADLNNITQESVIGRSIWEVWPGNVGTDIEKNYRRAMAEGVPVRFMHAYFEKDKFDLWLEIHAYPSPDGLAIFFHDVTELRRQAAIVAEDRDRLAEIENELRAAKIRIEATLSSADVGTWVFDIKNDRMNGDSNLGRIFGLDPESAQSGTAADYISKIHPDDQGAVRAALGKSIADGTRYEIEYRVLADGKERWVVARGMPETDEIGNVIQLPSAVVEITALKATQERERAALEAMRASEERFRQLVELSPSTVWVAEPDGGLTYISRDFYDLSGLSPETALPHGWATTVHPDDIERVAGEWAQARQHELPYDTEFRIRLKNGQYRWISARAIPVRDANGQVTGWLGSNSDIHEKKEIEQTLRDRVVERTAELQRTIEEAEGFNYSISHNLRAPLRAIISTSQILLEEAGPELDAPHRKLLERQSYNALRLADLIDELLRLSRFSRVPVNRESIDVTRLVCDVISSIRTPCNFEVEEGMKAEADANLVTTIFQNLLENACKFSPLGGTVHVGKCDSAFYVRDEGVGFDMKFASKIFHPFERLVKEEEFPGTGIGLANVKRLVERHGGRVWAESELGKGAKFSFTLSD